MTEIFQRDHFYNAENKLTTQDAINWFTDREKYYMIDDKVSRLEKIALEALKEKAERDEPKPLSVEDLIAITEETPLWYADLKDGSFGCWQLYEPSEFNYIQTDALNVDFALYRHKPKTETEKG